MSVIVKAGGPVAVLAKTNTSFIDMGLNTTNCTLVYQADGGWISWVPGRGLDGVTGLTPGVGYVFNLKVQMDLSAYLSDGTGSSTTPYAVVVPASGVVTVN